MRTKLCLRLFTLCMLMFTTVSLFCDYKYSSKAYAIKSIVTIDSVEYIYKYKCKMQLSKNGLEVVILESPSITTKSNAYKEINRRIRNTLNNNFTFYIDPNTGYPNESFISFSRYIDTVINENYGSNNIPQKAKMAFMIVLGISFESNYFVNNLKEGKTIKETSVKVVTSKENEYIESETVVTDTQEIKYRKIKATIPNNEEFNINGIVIETTEDGFNRK